MPDSSASSQITQVDFGVVRDLPEGENFALVPVAEPVRDALIEMLAATRATLDAERLTNGALDEFELSQTYGSRAALTFPLGTGHTPWIVQLIASSDNLQTDPRALDDPSVVTSYFAVFRTTERTKLVGVRRATQFKGVLKASLLRILDESLRLIEERVFRLDQDFDYIVSDDTIFIVRPAGFVHAMDEAYLMSTARQTALSLGQRLRFVEFAGIAEYVQRHSRGARLIAALNMRDDLDNTSRKCVEELCEEARIELVPKRHKLAPAPGEELKFLQLLDRRRWAMTLIANVSEVYEAASRRSVP